MKVIQIPQAAEKLKFDGIINNSYCRKVNFTSNSSIIEQNAFGAMNRNIDGSRE